ncbi:alpha-amylase family glycosyl hydrolase [Cellulosilyticum ruminicola]
MPKFNTNNEVVKAYLISVCEYWVKTYKVDGIRLDVANEVSHSFCKELRRKLKALNSEIYILGEIWNDAINWLRGDEFDAVMSYPLGENITNFWTRGNK